MKKTLAALAVLGAFAGSAMAADVTLYGLVDYGFSYEHVDGDTADKDAQDTFQMKSGQNSGSRFGLKGTEDLGNGLKVGFVLENGFTADDGKMDNSDRLFGRESNLFVTGALVRCPLVVLVSSPAPTAPMACSAASRRSLRGGVTRLARSSLRPMAGPDSTIPLPM